MRKLVLLLIFALLTTSVYAEQSAHIYTGNALMATEEQTVYIEAYNNSGTDFLATSHAVVVLDSSYTTATSAAAPRSSDAVGTYFTTTTTPGNSLVLGVTNGQAIADKSVGRIIVRGPAKIDLVPTPVTAYAAGATISTSLTAGFGTNRSIHDDPASTAVVIATLLAPSGDRYPASSGLGGKNTDVGSGNGAWESDNNVWWGWVGRE